MNKEIEFKLINNIGINRYNHSLSVMKVAMKLADTYGADIEKAKIAGLLHDCAKYNDNTYLLKRLKDSDIILDNIMLNNTELIHGPLGAVIAEKEYHIKDMEILDAIRYHTTGRANMTLLDKIIYLADYIEPGRKFPGVDKVREISYVNIDKALIRALNNTIRYLIDLNKEIHPDTILARNMLVREVYKVNEWFGKKTFYNY